jgi:hypothetical protein
VGTPKAKALFWEARKAEGREKKREPLLEGPVANTAIVQRARGPPYRKTGHLLILSVQTAREREREERECQ